MRDPYGSFSGTCPAELEAVIDEVRVEYPARAYAGSLEVDDADWSDAERDTVDQAILAGLVCGTI